MRLLVVAGCGWLVACGSSSGSGGGEGSSVSGARALVEGVPGWKVALRYSPKQREFRNALTLPGQVQVRGYQELDGVQHVFTATDTDPRRDFATWLLQDTTIAADGTITSTEAPNTPWNEGQIFWFSGQPGFYSAMRSTEIAVYNGNVEQWTDPDSYVFSWFRVIDGLTSFRCGARNQNAAIQDVCDGVQHQMTSGPMTGKVPIDMMMLPDGRIAYAGSPYPVDGQHRLGLMTLKLDASRALSGDKAASHPVSNHPYFTPASIAVTHAGDYIYGIIAGRTDANETTGVEQHGLTGVRLNTQTGEVTSIGQFVTPRVDGAAVRDPVSGRLAWLAVRDGGVKDLPPEPGMTTLKLQMAVQVVIFDPAREAFSALADLPVRVMTTDDYPGYTFLASLPVPKDPTHSLPGDLFWSGGKLYVAQYEVAMPTSLAGVVREVVIWTPEQ